MIKKIPIRYYETSSLLIQLNPVVKMVWLLILSVMILWSRDYRFEIGLFIITICLFKVAKIKLVTLQGSKFVIMTAVLIGLIQLLFNREGIPVLDVFGLDITLSGITKAIFISTRFLSFILLGYLFVITTEPNSFVYALMRIGLPYRFGFSLITAIRLIPIFTNEAHNIYHAQITRGVKYQFIPLKRFIENIFQFLKVLLISTIKKVDGLVLSMEGRSFGVKPERTFIRTANYSFVDKGLLFLAGVLTVIFIFYGRDLFL